MDLFLRIRDAAVKANKIKAEGLPLRLLEELRGKVFALKDALPEDLRSSLSFDL